MLSIVRRLLPDLGATYGPPGDGPFPSIMVLHGSEGGWAGWSHRNAVLLAAHGFLAYPHAYSRSGNAWNAGSIENIPLDDTEAALKALKSFQYCDGNIGLYGVSRGGEHALLLASLLAQESSVVIPDAIAVHTPADVIVGAFDAKRWRDRGDPGWQVWDPAERAWTWRGSSENLKPTTPIEIERYDGPLFLSHGTADQTWDVEMTRRLVARLRSHGKSPEVHYYEGEGHGFTLDAANEHDRLLVDFFTRHLKN